MYSLESRVERVLALTVKQWNEGDDDLKCLLHVDEVALLEP